MPSARAVRRSTCCTSTGIGRWKRAAASSHAPRWGPVSTVRPGPIRSSVDTGRPGGDPEVGEATAEVGAQLLLRGPVGALRISRAGDVVLGDRAPLGLIGVEEASDRPTRSAPRRASTRGRTRRGSPCSCRSRPRRHPVGGVADQERVALPEPLGQLGGEREAAGEQDVDRQVGDAGPAPDQLDEPLRREVGQWTAARAATRRRRSSGRRPAGTNTPAASGSLIP